jgi:membrane-bound lytic murein transglycosylase D
MRICVSLRRGILFSLISFCIAQPAFSTVSDPSNVIANSPETAVAVRAAQQQTAIEHVQLPQSKSSEPAVTPPPTQAEPQAVDAPAATAEKIPVTNAAVSEQKESSKITAPISILVLPTDKKSNEAIEKSFSLYTNNLKKKFSLWLERSARYIEIMKDILKEKNMPEELVFLPIVESGFSTQAYSSARAAGPWQFIAGTAKRYGLVIDWWRDERKDPVKSTIAAADYLKDLYDMFGSWSLALAAYNAGEGRIAKALKRTDSDNFWSLRNTKQIRQETKDYVPRYIAATMIANTPEEYGFRDLTYHEPFEYDEVILYVPVDLEVIAKCAGTSVDEIRELNPELRRWSTPPNLPEYTLRLPVDTADAFIANLSNVPDEKLFSYETYTVKHNETLKKIASKSGVPVNTLLALNSLAGIERLSPGEEIKLPPKGKYFADIDDKMTARKASLKTSETGKRHTRSQSRAAKKGSHSKSAKVKVAKGKSRAKIKTRKT